MIAPFLAIMHSIDPIIIPAAGGVTTAVMVGMMHYALHTPKSLIGWGPALHIGLWGLIGNGIVGCLLFPNNLSYMIDTFAGTALFMGITAYDTQCAIEAYQKKQPDHIGYATQFYLDFLNLFLRIARAMAEAKSRSH